MSTIRELRFGDDSTSGSNMRRDRIQITLIRGLQFAFHGPEPAGDSSARGLGLEIRFGSGQ